MMQVGRTGADAVRVIAEENGCCSNVTAGISYRNIEINGVGKVDRLAARGDSDRVAGGRSDMRESGKWYQSAYAEQRRKEHTPNREAIFSDIAR